MTDCILLGPPHAWNRDAENSENRAKEIRCTRVKKTEKTNPESPEGTATRGSWDSWKNAKYRAHGEVYGIAIVYTCCMQIVDTICVGSRDSRPSSSRRTAARLAFSGRWSNTSSHTHWKRPPGWLRISWPQQVLPDEECTETVGSSVVSIYDPALWETSTVPVNPQNHRRHKYNVRRGTNL